MGLLATYLGQDLREGWHRCDSAQEKVDALLSENDQLRAELGDTFMKGILPLFSDKKVRTYSSCWNWVRVDIVRFFQGMVAGEIADKLTLEQRRKVHHVMNRANKSFFEFIAWNTKVAVQKGGDRKAGYVLASDVPAFAPAPLLCQILAAPPVWIPVNAPTRPKTDISPSGEISYSEVPRDGCANWVAYSKEPARMASGVDMVEISAKTQLRGAVTKLQRLQSKRKVAKREMNVILQQIGLTQGARLTDESEADPDARLMPKKEKKEKPKEKLPLLNCMEYNRHLTEVYLQALNDIVSRGVTFANKVALVNGAGRNSINSEVVSGLLAGGCKVQYENWGAKGSKLFVLPFNGGSAQDCSACLDIDFVLPFAAMPQQGIEVTDIGQRDEPELALRVMLVNVHRLIGKIAKRKEQLGQQDRPAMCVLPLSPNHGTFGGDGFYAESKIGLEPLFNKWHSENWSRYLTIAGASMGWVRGTGLMSVNNRVAEGMEKMGLRTFSVQEMAVNIITLMHPTMVKVAEREPVYADLCGGLQLLPNVAS
eukprot:gene47144-67071_t